MEHVVRSKCGFKSYCDIMSARYKSMGLRSKFMSPTTFRTWFRCWASHQDREFRKVCPGGDCEALACDGTAIGNVTLISASKTGLKIFRVPLESCRNQHDQSVYHLSVKHFKVYADLFL